ncbi:hypothetical protein PF002_g11914 [Phytophthora fragariae]|uniref:Vacuolar protein sorting-associated protein n=1 Tax=Phytophthora fragariae TaxID=53985 RepID=A0A6A3ZBT8_9STRA|nr:hypothetical protein PF002_g11914 [Phytophthora fragariae]
MFETLVTGLLTSALGSYIEPKCFSSDKINVAVWSGYVVLTELEVKPEVVAELPAVRLVRGLVGSIELKIPWNRLQSDSVVATVDDVYLLLRTEEDIDAVMRQMDEFTLKKKLLEELYAQAKRQEQETADAAATEGGFAARLVNKIIDNLELHIRRIHIRIEDHNSGDHPFAMGLTIESVHVQSTNSNWQPSYVDTAKNNEPRIFKIVELNHLSVYCNPDCELQRDRQVDFETCSAEEFSSAFSRAIPKRFDDRHYHHMQLYPSQQQHHFLLKPIDASARLIVNRDVFDANVPKFEVDMNVSEVAFRLEESQYCDMLYLASALQIPDHYTKYQRHRKFRPQAAVFDDPAEWWRYAITAVLKDQQAKKQQWTWGFMKDRREDRKQYVGLWQQKSHQLLELADVDYVYSDSDDNDDADDNGNTEDDEQGVKPGLSPLDQAHIQRLSSFEIDAGLEEIERRRSTEDVLFFRYLADLEVRNFRATRASRVRRRLPTPPTHKSHAFSDTDSVDTEITESSVPAEVRYRSWGAWMFGWTSKLATPSPDGEAGQAPHRIIPEVELRELFKILEEPSRRTKKRVHKHREAGGPDGVSDSESQMELSELYRVTVTLQRGSVTLASDPETNKTLLRDDPSYGRKYAPTDFLLGTFSQLQVAAVARDETVAVDVSLQSIEAFDESAESSAFSRLLSRKQTIRPAGDGDDVNVSKLSGVVFLMSYEMNPATSSADASLFVHMEPLEIVLSPTARCWGRLAKFMDTPSSLGLWEELEVASFNDIVNLKTRTEAKLDYVMENRIALAVDLRIQAPVIIVPESDTDYNCARLVVDLGRINFRTDRLSQMDSDQMSMSSTGGPPSSRSAPGSIALLSPSHFRGVNSNTSFVQQLYDEAERGEGAIRWKEEFYDKFSLSITNIHVLLIPYGKTSRVQDDGAGSSGMNYPSVSLPPYLTNIYDEEQEYELVERFNINVTVRMSILPLDATLTRFYIHADLPALTFNLSLEKYFQLLALADRFSLANAEVPKKTRKYSGGAFYPAESAYGNDEINMPNSEDGHEAMRRGSFLSTSALKKFMLNDNESIGPPSANGALADDAGDSDENASVESDDTWFSIYSGNLDQSASSLSGELEHNLSLSDFSDSVAKEDGRSVSIPPRSERRTRKRPRPYTPGGSTKLLDRRLMVCSFTVPLISVQLKKPRSAAVSSYTSYRYDTSDFDDDPADNGTILVKLQGFRVRVGQKTLSTQLDVSLMSLEVEDFHDASGRSTQYLLFSCPTIAAPFSIKAPLRRGGKFPGYAAQRKRPNRQRERVISFQVGGAKNSDGSVSASPETLLELGFSSLKDQKSGKEVLRDVDLQLGSVQFNFDQSYVCSLLELFEESSSQLALVPASSRNGMGSGDITSADTDDGLPPPFELTPTIKQEYSIPVNLTESVRADLERARKNLFEQAPDTLKIPVAAGDNDALPVALKLGIRLHSVSVCFSDRGESVVSLAVLDSQVQVGTAKAGQIDVSGLVGDVKVFDLSSKKRQEDGLGISGAARGLESPADYIEIFGLDTSASFSTGDIRHVLSVDCLISSESNLTASEGNVQARQNKSRLSVSVQPVRFLAQPEFVENLANYVVDGPLRTHFLSKHVALSDAGMENERKRADSMADFQLAPRFSPNADHPPESLTPFFDAVDTTNRDGRQLKFEATSPQTPPPCDIVAANAQENQSVQGNDSAKRDGIALIVAHIIDNFDLEVKLFHPCVVLPSTPLKDIRVSLQSQPYRGIVLDFGTILITLRREISDALPDAPVCTPYQAKVTVKSLQITSLADQTAILDPSGFEIRCSIPAQDMNYDDRGTNGALPGISLDVEIYQVCLNVSETNACLALEVFYVAVIPMFDTTQEVIRQLESYERVLVAEPATLRPEDGGDLESASFGANGDMTKWGQLSLHFLLEEFKIACISYSEAPQQFETWMKSVIDIPDEVSSRESSGGASSAAQGRSYPQHFMGRRGSFPSEIPCCVIGKIALVAIEANLAMGLEGKPLMDSDVQLQCDFSLQEVIIRDKIADPTEFLTHLFAPVPGALLERMDSRTSISSDSSSISFLSRDDMLPPVLRPSTSHSSRMDVSSSQISGRLISKRGVGAGFDSAVTVNSLDVSVSSARFILLPRTLLRLEHFVLDVFLAASKKRSEMEIQRDEALVNNPPGVENAAYADAAIDMDDNRGERQESRFTVPPLRPRNDSISESLKDDLNAVRSAFMSPLQRMLSSASAKDTRPPGSFTSRVIAEETGSGTSAASKTKSPGSVGQGDADRRRLPIPQWKVDARFSNLQMWVISTDRKADVAGCVLSHQLIVKFDSALNGAETSTASDSNEIVAASVRLSKVEVSVGSPKTAELDFSTAEPQSKPTYHTGTLVESFEVDVQFVLRHCFRPTLAETIDPESSDEKSDENSEMNSGDAYNGDTGGDADAKASPWVNYSPTNKADSAAVSLPELFLRDVPSEWQEWLLCEPTVRIDQIVSHIAYRDLPLLLKISASLASMLSAEKKIRDAFVARLKTATDDLDWTDLPDAPGDYSEYAHYFGAEDLDDSEVSRQDEPSVPQYDVLTRASLIASGIQFRLINNIVDQASPVVEFDSKAIEVLLRSESNSMVEVTACCRAEAMYQNLRLVTMEPLIEPWSVKVVLSQQRSHGRSLDDRGQLALSPWKLDISSDVFLQLNLTDALIANLVAADRAWRWVVNAGGDSREMTEYSTYWIRNNTGMPLRYWGASYNEHSLAPGQEEPLRFNKEQPESDGRGGKEKRRKGGRRNMFVHDRQLFIAVEEEYPSDSLSNVPRKWQSEAPIPVDQVDSRMYALVDFEADVTATRMRKCECVIDVLVERGCKYFVVRSTLNLENQTSSDIEVEFVPPQRRSMSRSLRTGSAPQGHVIPIWKKIVKASSVVPVPVHIVSSGEGYVLVRPPEINGTDTGDGTSVLPKAYAKERVHLPLFDRGSSSANENIVHMESDESGQSQCTIKFRRLYSDRPVRPFMMNVCLSSASSALYHRTLSFHPPLIVHNLTAGPLDFCLATSSDWTPAVEAVTLTNAGMNAGWETREQRLRERGTISAADSLIWHLSSEETPLELSVRMKGFDWSEPLELDEDLGDIVRIKMKDLVSDAYLYITAEIRMSKGHCRELFLYVPYWIVNLTGLKLEYEYDEERMGREHTTTLLAGQKRLDRDELLLKESQRAKASRRDRNPHLLHPVLVENQEFIDGVGDIAQQSKSSRSASPDSRESERKRRHPRLLPSVPPVKGLLDLLPKTIEYDPRSLGQLEVLQACHSDYRLDRGCVRLRVSNDRDMAALDARKENGQRKWSDPFVLDQAGTIGEIEADDYGANRKFSIGYSIIPAKGQYSRTKVIMLTPRFMLINTMSSAIEVCHSSSKMMTPSVIDMANTTGSMPNSRVMSPVNPVVQLDAGAFADFHWTLRFAKTRTIRCRFAEYGWSWSGAVPLVESGEYAVRMRHESTRESKLVRVTLKLDSSCVCVYFREERTTAPPYRVENYSLETLRTHQHRVRRSEILLPHHSLDYAWDEPTEERLLVVDMLPSAAGDNSRPLRIGSFDLDKIQQYPDALGGTLGIEISTDGPTRVLRFTDTRLRGKKAVPVNSKVANDLAAKTEGTENSALQLLQRFVAVPTVHAALHLQGVGISIADSAPKELVYMSISGIALEILVSEDDRNKSAGSIAGSAASLSRLERETRPRIIACCLEVNDVQVDNQLQVTPYPVLLRFSNPNGRSRIVNGQTVSIPVLQVGLVKHDEYAGIEFIRHFSVSVLPVHIRVDGALLYQILPLLVHAKIYGSGGNSATTTKKRAVVLVNGGSSSDEVSRAAHSHLLLKDFNASLEVPVKVLEAAQKDGTTSAGPTSGPPTPTMKMVSRRSSGQQQLISPRQNHQHTALAAEIQRYTATKYGSIGAIAVKDEQKKLYFEEFHIDPIRATVSFSFGDSAGAILDGHLSSLSHAAALTDPSSSRDSSVITVGPLRLILNAIGTSLTKIANAPFQLKALHIHNSFVQPDALATRLASHYQSEALRQAYVILGSVDVLGNPMIAWKNLRSGFQDFISEPAHGLSQRSPQAFAFGVGRGSLSLVRASVYTFLDFNTRILTAFSLGLSEACLKLDDYTGYPATRHIFQGLVQGVSGVVVAPIHSFEVNGARGVLPGLVAGAFGVVLKPLLGFSLATATTAATLRDAVDPNTKALLVRVRPPRHIDLRTKRLKVYSYVESLGEEIVGKIRGGRYRADGYLGHVDLKATHQCFLVTRKRILFLNVKGLASAQTTKYEVQWELLAEEVVMVDCSRTPSEQIITIYYMEDEFRAANGAGHSARVANGSNAVTTTRRRTPGVPRGMFLQKHEVALPDTKVLFVRAMLQQQERSLLTKMNSYTKDGTPHHLSPLARTNSMDLSSAWQPQHPHMPMEYPIFRLPPSLHQTRSFANLAQTNPSHTHHYNQQQKS